MREDIMKKHVVILFTIVLISIVSFTSCEPFIENKITIENRSLGTVFVNLKAAKYTINSGDILVLNDFDRGEYDFETTYSVPIACNTSTAEGDVAGTMNLIGGTEIYLLYSYGVTGSGDNITYILYGSMTSSDDVKRVDPFGDNTGGN